MQCQYDSIHIQDYLVGGMLNYVSTFKYLSVYMVEFSSLDNVVCLKTILIICGITVDGQQTTPKLIKTVSNIFRMF